MVLEDRRDIFGESGRGVLRRQADGRADSYHQNPHRTIHRLSLSGPQLFVDPYYQVTAAVVISAAACCSFTVGWLVAASLAGTCAAQLPDYYKTVNRVTWVVGNIDKVRPAWEALGLSDIEEYPNIQLVGEFRGKPVTIYAWQITGHLGNLTVDMMQPGEGQANAYTNFLGKHGDGILSIVHEVPSRQALETEILRMKERGVGVLQQVTVRRDGVATTYTYFDTEPEGKFALGLVYRQGGMGAAAGRGGGVAHQPGGVGCGGGIGLLGEAGIPGVRDAACDAAAGLAVSRAGAFAGVRCGLSAPHAVPL